MNKKKIFFIILICFVGLVIVFFLKNNNETPEDKKQDDKLQDLKSEKMIIETEGGVVEISNVYKDLVKELSDNGVNFEKNDYFYFAYYPEDDGFIISILNPDIKASRKVAESEFLKKLNINEDQACLLKVSLSVPFSVNAEAAGDEYGLSFCPNGKPFPGE